MCQYNPLSVILPATLNWRNGLDREGICVPVPHLPWANCAQENAEVFLLDQKITIMWENVSGAGLKGSLGLLEPSATNPMAEKSGNVFSWFWRREARTRGASRARPL